MIGTSIVGGFAITTNSSNEGRTRLRKTSELKKQPSVEEWEVNRSPEHFALTGTGGVRSLDYPFNAQGLPNRIHKAHPVSSG